MQIFFQIVCSEQFFTIDHVTSFTSCVQMTGKQNQSGYPKEHKCERSDIIKVLSYSISECSSKV